MPNFLKVEVAPPSLLRRWMCTYISHEKVEVACPSLLGGWGWYAHLSQSGGGALITLKKVDLHLYLS